VLEHPPARGNAGSAQDPAGRQRQGGFELFVRDNPARKADPGSRNGRAHEILAAPVRPRPLAKRVG
jgi:hypothetical protein